MKKEEFKIANEAGHLILERLIDNEYTATRAEVFRILREYVEIYGAFEELMKINGKMNKIDLLKWINGEMMV